MMDGRGAATRGAVVWFRGSVFAFAIFASPAPVAAAERAAQPAAGAWDVIKVAVDRRDQMHWLYKPDDPRLLGRELMISAHTALDATDQFLQLISWDPTKGAFNVSAWIMPFAALLAGGLAVIYFLRTWKSRTVFATPGPVDDAKYRQQLEEELKKFTPED